MNVLILFLVSLGSFFHNEMEPSPVVTKPKNIPRAEITEFGKELLSDCGMEEIKVLSNPFMHVYAFNNTEFFRKQARILHKWKPVLQDPDRANALDAFGINVGARNLIGFFNFPQTITYDKRRPLMIYFRDSSTPIEHSYKEILQALFRGFHVVVIDSKIHITGRSQKHWLSSVKLVTAWALKHYKKGGHEITFYASNPGFQMQSTSLIRKLPDANFLFYNASPDLLMRMTQSPLFHGKVINIINNVTTFQKCNTPKMVEMLINLNLTTILAPLSSTSWLESEKVHNELSKCLQIR